MTAYAPQHHRRAHLWLPPLAFALNVYACSAAAQNTGQSAGTADPQQSYDEEVITVTAQSTRGYVATDIQVEMELTTEEIAEFGASSISELLDALGPSVSTGRGRGGERPIVLLNGQRISSFREIRDLPPEAIERVQVFPEELALQYGYRPDQRVVNFILKPDFASIGIDLKHGFSSKGGYAQSEFDGTYTRIRKTGRLTVDLEYEFSDPLTEADRGIVQAQRADVGLAKDAEFRTLLGESDRVELTANWSHMVSPATSVTLSGDYARSDTVAGLGLADVTLLVPEDSPFSRTDEAETIYRFLPALGSQQRSVMTDAATAGATLNTRIGAWQLDTIANYGRTSTDTVIDSDPDLSALIADIAAGSAAIDPLAETLAAELSNTQALAQTLNQDADTSTSIRGRALMLPAGDVSLSATAGFNWASINSQSGDVVTDLERSTGFGRATIDIPLTSRDNDVVPWLGDLSVNGNAGYSHLSDFGGLTEFGYGLKWKPLEPISITASFIGEETAPSLNDLGDPLITTPNVSVFDGTTGQSVLIARTTGGNDALLVERRRDLKVTLSYKPWDDLDHRFITEYLKNKSENVTSAFPLLTPEIEAAFPGRVVRDEAGQLLSLDARPINLAQVRSESLRTGIELRGRFEAAAQSGGRGERGPGGDGPGGRRGGGRGGSQGGWQVSLYHTYAFDESVIIDPAIPALDLLAGSTIDTVSPAVRHSVELAARVFKNGKGLRVSADYTGAGRINGSDAPGSTDLVFNDIFTLDLRAFYNFDTNTDLVAKVPFLKGSRVSFGINNLFGGIQSVTDDNGDVPIAYQPGYVDPQGRVISLSFRKLF